MFKPLPSRARVCFRNFAIGMLFHFFPNLAAAQTEEVSVLPQYFAANPLIRRDPLFETLHTSLNTAMQNTGLGLNENITAKLDELERYVNGFSFDVSSIPGSRPGSILFQYKFFGFEGSKTIARLADVDTVARQVAEKFILEALKRISVGPAAGDRMDLNKLLLFTLSSAVQKESIDLSKFTDFNAEKFSQDFSHDFTQYLKSVVNFPFDGDAARFDYNVQILQTKLKALVDNMKGNIVAKKYELEDAIEKVKKQASSSLLSANAGLGINQSEGNLGGGLMMTFKMERPEKSTRLGMGIFVNGVGELGSKDTSAIKQPFLVGFALQYRFTDNFQITAIGSGKYNKEELSNSHWVAEAGTGILYRTSEGLIIGGSAYYLFVDEKKVIVTDENNSTSEQRVQGILTAGLTLRGNAISSPTVLLGFSRQGSTTTPVFQISYPINFNNQ